MLIVFPDVLTLSITRMSKPYSAGSTVAFPTFTFGKLPDGYVMDNEPFPVL